MTRRSARFQAGNPHLPTATGGRASWTFEVLHRNSSLSDPMGKAFDYAKEFKTLDLNAVVKDLQALMTNRRNGGRPISAITADS